MENSNLETPVKKRNFLVRVIMDNKFFIIFIVLLLFVRFFILSVNEVKNVSMMPTLEDGDIVIVDQEVYKLTGLDRFDIVIFKYTMSTEEKFLIKRVVGLPGETVQVVDGILYVNGSELTYDDDMIALNANTPDFNSGLIPEGSYYVLGDNRVNSIDSRSIGPVIETDISGHVLFRIKPFNKMRFLALAF